MQFETKNIVLKVQVLTFILLRAAGLQENWSYGLCKHHHQKAALPSSVTVTVQKIPSRARKRILKEIFKFYNSSYNTEATQNAHLRQHNLGLS